MAGSMGACSMSASGRSASSPNRSCSPASRLHSAYSSSRAASVCASPGQVSSAAITHRVFPSGGMPRRSASRGTKRGFVTRSSTASSSPLTASDTGISSSTAPDTLPVAKPSSSDKASVPTMTAAMYHAPSRRFSGAPSTSRSKNQPTCRRAPSPLCARASTSSAMSISVRPVRRASCATVCR